MQIKQGTCNALYFTKDPTRHVFTQGVYNRLLLVPIVGGTCFQRHQLAAVLMRHLASFR